MQPPIFISLTTISQRLNVLDQVLERLIDQTLSADRIILNISLDPFMFDAGIRFEHLPPQTRKWVVSGVVDLYYCKNTGPYRKIMPVLERFKSTEYFVATADDDVLYPPEWLAGLVDVAMARRCVAAYRCRLIEGSGAKLAPYNAWPVLASPVDLDRRGLEGATPSLRLFPTGRDGVIYHSSFFKNLDVLRRLQSVAPGQDDIALKFTTLLAGIPVMIASRQNTSSPNGIDFPPANCSGSALYPRNYAGGNDKALNDVIEWFRRNSTLDIQKCIDPGTAAVVLPAAGDCAVPAADPCGGV